MSRLTDRLEHDLREIAAGARPSASAWESITARLDENAGLEVPLRPSVGIDRSKRPFWLLAAAAALFVITASVAVFASVSDDPSVSTADRDLAGTFFSPRNGFSIEPPDGASVTPAKQLWQLSEQSDDGFDVVTIDPNTVFKGTTRVGDGSRPCSDAEYDPNACASLEAQVDRYLSDVLPGGCGVPRRQQEEITVDGRPGRIAECPNHIEASVLFAGRLYLFTLSHERSDARAVFDALVATIDLTPETAVDYPGMTTTYVSQTYGYSFDYHDGGGLEPATELWDADDQPPVDIGGFDPRFDGLETDFGASFQAASTPIPEGVSVDEWVDTYVTPPTAGGCGVRRSQQEEISIDGQPARTAACDHAEATVVAGGRLYLFTGPNDDREWFGAWLATIELTPETAESPG